VIDLHLLQPRNCLSPCHEPFNAPLFPCCSTQQHPFAAMPRKAFIADIKAASEAVIAGISSVARGDDDEEVAVCFTHPSGAPLEMSLVCTGTCRTCFQFPCIQSHRLQLDWFCAFSFQYGSVIMDCFKSMSTRSSRVSMVFSC
jgi:hypothetical protein